MRTVIELLGIVVVLKIIDDGIGRLIGEGLVIIPIRKRIVQRPKHQGGTQKKTDRCRYVGSNTQLR